MYWWRGKEVSLGHDGADGPFAARPDRQLVLSGLRDLMAMRSAGDLVIYGIGAPESDVSFIVERGAGVTTSVTWSAVVSRPLCP